MITLGAVSVGAAVTARHRAQAAADLAALGGAASVTAGADTACAQASVLARAMGTAMVGCAVDGLDVILSVEAATGLRLPGYGAARAVARAGPGDST